MCDYHIIDGYCNAVDALVVCLPHAFSFVQDPAVAIAFDENGEVAPVPIDDPLMDDLFPLAEACLADLGVDVTLLRYHTYTYNGRRIFVEALSLGTFFCF